MSNVTELGTQVAWYGMFLDCKNLEEINLSNWDISNVARMGSMFTNCSALKELNLNDFKTNNVTDKATYEWFKEKCPNYLNCIYIVKSDDNKLN